MATHSRGGQSAENKSGQVTLRGRFRPGTQVALYEVDERALRPHEEAKPVARSTVDKDGELTFEDGVSEGGFYIAFGYYDGFPLQVRLRGRAADAAPTDVLAPVTQDEVRFRDGQVVPDRGQPKLPPVTQAPPDAAKKRAIAERKELDEKERARKEREESKGERSSWSKSSGKSESSGSKGGK